MRFSLQSLLLSFVVSWTAIVAFGHWGIVVTAGLFGIAVYYRAVRFMSGAARKAWWILAGLFLHTSMIALVVGMVESTSYPSRFASCANHLRMIKVALDDYQNKNGSFPPAYIADSSGKPMVSWRTLLLPFLDENALYAQYNQKEAWDGPNNRKLPAPRGLFTWAYEPESQPMTSCLAMVGTNTAWRGAMRMETKRSARWRQTHDHPC